MRAALILPLLLAACAGGMRAPSWPDDVSFRGDVMRVSFNDGTRCSASAAQGTGTLGDCRYPLHYRIEDFRPSHLAGVPGIGGLFQPYARVVLSDASGRSWTFRTPRPIATRDQGDGTLVTL